MQGKGAYFLKGQESGDITFEVKENASSHEPRVVLVIQQGKILSVESESARWRGSDHLGLGLGGEGGLCC